MRNKILLLVIIMSSSFLKAQDHLIPSKPILGENDNYEWALNNFFKDGYSDDVLINVLIRPTYGKEYLLGLKKEESTFKIFAIIPDSSIWYSSFIEVPCYKKHNVKRQSRETSETTCSKQDFDLSNEINYTLKELQISDNLSDLLISSWNEMLYKSKFSYSNLIISHGVNYDFMSKSGTYNTLHGSTKSPDKGTQPYQLTEITEHMYLSLMIDSLEIKKQQLDSISIKSELLLTDILESGNRKPSSRNSRVNLTGCETKFINKFNADYCWTAKLDYDPYPELFISSKYSESFYRYLFIDYHSENEYSEIEILPVFSRYVDYYYKKIKFTKSINEYFLIKPWNILDLNTATIDNQIKVFGIDNYKIADTNIIDSLDLNDNTKVILFDGIYFNDLEPKNLTITGDFKWRSIKTLFNKK